MHETIINRSISYLTRFIVALLSAAVGISGVSGVTPSGGCVIESVLGSVLLTGSGVCGWCVPGGLLILIVSRQHRAKCRLPERPCTYLAPGTCCLYSSTIL